MKRLLAALVLAIGLASASANELSVVYFLGTPAEGMQFLSAPCPYVDPSYSTAQYFHYGMTVSGSEKEDFCWARLWDGRIGIIVAGPTGLQEMVVDEAQLQRGPAPKPKAMPDPNAKET